MSKNQGYNPALLKKMGKVMPKLTPKVLKGFGKRLISFRNEAGYTQTELAEEIGVSRRVITYYEGESDNPPASLIVDLIKPLNVTADELLGITVSKQKAKQPDNRLLRRMQKIDKLSSTKKRQLLSIIDTYIEAER